MLGLLGTPATGPAAARRLAVVKAIRYWSNSSYTRVVVDADREVDFIHHLLNKDPDLNKPPRLYVDLSRSTIAEGLQTSISINDDLMSNVRSSRYTSDSVRVVIDIKSFDTYHVFALRDPFRIVIDLWGTNGAARTTAGPAQDTRHGGPRDLGSSNIPRGALARQLALGVRRIVVDPGHGGKDFGAPGYMQGIHEKDVVLTIARRVAAKIRDDLGIEAILTRNDDRYLSLEERTALANTRHADLFVSIHTNAARNPRARGIETYFLNLATDDESIRVAAMENATSTKNISEIHSILNDLLKNAKINESRHLAELVQNSLIAGMSQRGYRRIEDKGVKQAPFYVLIGARMPSILVETSFISNREECRRLVTSAYQNHLAESIVQGLRGYIRAIDPVALQ
jgi:N-acetylmuramoyl-L-alanine amidase